MCTCVRDSFSMCERKGDEIFSVCGGEFKGMRDQGRETWISFSCLDRCSCVCVCALHPIAQSSGSLILPVVFCLL